MHLSLTIAKIKELLGKDYKGERVDRFEIPNIYAVHFLLKNHLDRGVASTSTYDYLGKNGKSQSCSLARCVAVPQSLVLTMPFDHAVAEYLRAKYVEVPVKFLERGKI